MLRVDRQCARDAQFVIEVLIPDTETRARWLHLLADAVESADRVQRGSWAITLFDAKLRLNVGKIETVVFWPSDVMLVLDAACFTDAEIHEACLGPLHGRLDVYASVPGTLRVDVPYATDARVLDGYRPALVSLVERAASQVQTRTGYYGSHSPGMVDYLASATSRHLRQPDHSIPGARRADRRRR